MALYITVNGVTSTWWVGMPLPEDVDARVVKFQADGHELEVIVKALKETRDAD